MAERRFSIQLLGDTALSAKLASLTADLERTVLGVAFRKAAELVLADAQRRVNVGPHTSPTGAGTPRQVRRRRRQGKVVAGIRATLFVAPLRQAKNRIGYTVQTGKRRDMGITGRYYYPAHVELGHAAPGQGVRAVRQGRTERRARVREFGGRRTPAHPYLRPALMTNKARLLAQISQDIRYGIEQVGQEK